MPRLLVVHHTPSPNLQAVLEAVREGVAMVEEAEEQPLSESAMNCASGKWPFPVAAAAAAELAPPWFMASEVRDL